MLAILAFLPALCASTTFSSRVYLYPPTSESSRGQSGPSQTLLAQHLGLEAFEPLVPSNGQTVLGETRTFVGEGNRDALMLSLDAAYAQDVIPPSLKPSFALSSSSPSSFLDLYTYFARKTYDSVTDSSSTSSSQPPRLLDIFSASTTSQSAAASRFITSLSKLVSFVEDSDRTSDAARFGAFQIEGLEAIAQEVGRESELYQTATATLKATILSAMSQDLNFVVLHPVHPGLHSRQSPELQPPQTPFPAPQIPPSSPVFSTSTCFTSFSACQNATASCSSRGQCVGATRAGRTCFVCECGKAPLQEGGRNVSWAGGMCQKQDISTEFTLIVGTVIFLILLSVGSISLLYTVGYQELPGTLTGGLGGGPIKRE
ncbi:hypothetical protein K439DRAFT_1657487 [Ramaria rubella]|nr:hypothetical protein K439DRAFT_1657487 [Ramaria rubella]